MSTKSSLTTSYQEYLIESLKDPQEALAYLNAALEEREPELFLLALRNVAQANGGMSEVSRKAKLNREGLYRSLSKKGNPELSSLQAILAALNLEFRIQKIA